MNSFMRLAYLLNRAWLRYTRAVTLGTRAIVIENDSILLVRLTYHRGWFLPGGGVDRGETFEESMVRELLEECGIKALKWRLQGIYLNRAEGRIDHVASFIVDQFSGTPKVQDRREIAEVRFFPLTSLPPDLRKGHRRRIEELGSNGHSPRW